MDKDLLKLQEILKKKMPIIVEAIEKEEPLTEKYHRLIENFNSSMVVYSQIISMFAARIAEAEKNNKEEEKNGTNN